MLKIIVAIFIAIMATVAYSARKEYRKNAEKWNDGKCFCGKGDFELKDTETYEDVGTIYTYSCTCPTCNVEVGFLRKMH